MIFFFCAFSLSAQKDTSRPHLSDDKYEPKYNKALSYNYRNGMDYGSGNKKYDTRAVKFCPSLLARKTFALGIEKQFTDFGMELNIGYCWGLDDILKIGVIALDEGYNYYSEKVDLLTLLSASSGNQYGGLYLAGSAKFLWSQGEAFDGYYIGVSGRHSNFGFDVDTKQLQENSSAVWTTGASNKIKISNSVFHVVQGYQWNGGKKRTIVQEFFIAFGGRYTKYTEINILENYNSTTYTSSRTLLPTSYFSRSFGLSCAIGYVIGFGF